MSPCQWAWLWSPDHFWAAVCKTVRRILSDRCLSVLSVCDVVVLWPNSWMGQDETWHAGRPRPRPHCVRWGLSSLRLKKGHRAPHSWPMSAVAQTAAWIKMPLGTKEGPRPRRHCVKYGSSSPKKGHSAPTFRPMFILAKRSPISASAELLLNFAVCRDASRRAGSSATAGTCYIRLGALNVSSIQLLIGLFVNLTVSVLTSISIPPAPSSILSFTPSSSTLPNSFVSS